MKIIKDGKNPFQKTCKRCDCEFIYDSTDIKSTMDDDFDDIRNCIYFVNCPCCSMTINVSTPATRNKEENFFDL
jgi:hypothetical protein